MRDLSPDKLTKSQMLPADEAPHTASVIGKHLTSTPPNIETEGDITILDLSEAIKTKLEHKISELSYQLVESNGKYKLYLILKNKESSRLVSLNIIKDSNKFNLDPAYDNVLSANAVYTVSDMYKVSKDLDPEIIKSMSFLILTKVVDYLLNKDSSL